MIKLQQIRVVPKKLQFQQKENSVTIWLWHSQFAMERSTIFRIPVDQHGSTISIDPQKSGNPRYSEPIWRAASMRPRGDMKKPWGCSHIQPAMDSILGFLSDLLSTWYLSTHLPIYLHLFVCLSICLSIYIIQSNLNLNFLNYSFIYVYIIVLYIMLFYLNSTLCYLILTCRILSIYPSI